MTILDTIIADQRLPECAKTFFVFHHKAKTNDNEIRPGLPKLYASCRGKRVRVVAATPTGRCGVTERLEDETTPQEYVGISELTQFLATPYPVRPKPVLLDIRDMPIDATRDEVLRFVSKASGLPPETIMGSRNRRSVPRRVLMARWTAIGMLIADGSRNPFTVGAILGICHSTVINAMSRMGLRGPGVDEFDRNFLRAIWVKGQMPIGHQVGAIPPAVVSRLGEHVTRAGNMVEVSVRYSMAVEARAGDAPKKRVSRADAEVAADLLAIEFEGELQCAA